MIEPNDPHWDTLTNAAKDAKTRPAAWLEQSQFYADLADNTVFATAFDNWLTRLWADGTRATLKAYISG